MSKADYVRYQQQTRAYRCHWPQCEKPVPPVMWGCKAHWFKLPAALRARIWQTYRPGQENDMAPSREYLNAAQDVQAWIAKQGGK